MGPGALGELLKLLPKNEDKNLVVGFDTSDDGAVYILDENTAMIQTVDFFPPMVDDPYTFGQVAAANALSDIYAMGGTPKLAMNLVCVPNCLPAEDVADILKGGAEKVKEAGALLAGGHTIEDDVPKYGLSVTGFAQPSNITANSAAQVGDVLVLTKPLGTGILNTVFKYATLEDYSYNELIKYMTMLNAAAARAMNKTGVSACTDITGFGFLGHTYEMASGSGVTIEIDHSKLPLMAEVHRYAREGMIPAGASTNYEYLKDFISFAEGVPEEFIGIMCDPQTSGGLLIALAPQKLDMLEQYLKEEEVSYSVVGKVLPKTDKFVVTV